jgi:hypothetical protein
MVEKLVKTLKNSWAIARNNRLFFGSVALCFLALFFIVIFINFMMPINFDYTGNNTYTKVELSAQTVPTVINGIIASTSVIIAFSGAVVGLMYRDIVSKSDVAGAVTFIILLLFLTSITYDFYAFYAFSLGGKYYLEFAFKNAFTGFVVSLFMLFLAFLMIVEIMSRLERKQRLTV